jgi:RsiW-degrading membrane proteinase PrsW (M82 family)
VSTTIHQELGSSRSRRYAWLPVLVVGIVLFELVRHAVIATQNPNLVPALLLLGAAVVPVAFVTLIDGLRLPYSVPLGTLVLTAVLGGVIGVVTAGLLENDTLHRLPWLGVGAVAVIEESAKLLVPLVILLWGRYRRPADGLVIGVAAAAGFAILETMGYAFVALIQSRGSIGAVDGILMLRGLLSPAAHMAWTGVSAAALWQAAACHWSPRATTRFVAVFALAIGLHAAWDGIHTLAAYIALAAAGLGCLYLTIRSLLEPSAPDLRSIHITSSPKESSTMNTSTLEPTAQYSNPAPTSRVRHRRGIGVAAIVAVAAAFGAGVLVDHTAIHGGSASIDSAAPKTANPVDVLDHGAFSIQLTITNNTDQDWTLAPQYTYGSDDGGHWAQRPATTLAAGKSEVVSSYSNDIYLGQEMQVAYTMPNGDYVVANPFVPLVGSNGFETKCVCVGDQNENGWVANYDKNFTVTSGITHGSHVDANFTVSPATS